MAIHIEGQATRKDIERELLKTLTRPQPVFRVLAVLLGFAALMFLCNLLTDQKTTFQEGFSTLLPLIIMQRIRLTMR